jgi:hypothetical protein
LVERCQKQRVDHGDRREERSPGHQLGVPKGERGEREDAQLEGRPQMQRQPMSCSGRSERAPQNRHDDGKADRQHDRCRPGGNRRAPQPDRRQRGQLEQELEQQVELGHG